MQLTFLGAAGEVTGSCYLVDTGEIRFLIDCGMFQGGGEAERKNRSFAFDPRDIAFVLLSHAHIDHSGLIPRLVALGFEGAVYATRATADLLGVMLPDSAHLQEREAERAETGHSGRSRDATPLYTVRQAVASLERLRPVEYDQPVRLHPSVRCAFRDAGHILGSAILEIWLGRSGARPSSCSRAISASPAARSSGTRYGSRKPTCCWSNRPTATATTRVSPHTLEEFAAALNETLATGKGNVVIPAFAVGRTQEILYFIAELAGRAASARSPCTWTRRWRSPRRGSR